MANIEDFHQCDFVGLRLQGFLDNNDNTETFLQVIFFSKNLKNIFYIYSEEGIGIEKLECK